MPIRIHLSKIYKAIKAVIKKMRLSRRKLHFPAQVTVKPPLMFVLQILQQKH